MRITLQHLPSGDGNPAKKFTINYVSSGDLPNMMSRTGKKKKISNSQAWRSNMKIV